MKTITTTILVLCLMVVKGFCQCGTAPTSITMTPATGANCGINYSVVGGVLPPGGNYFWYKDGCGIGLVATGPYYFRMLSGASVGPFTYYVRIEAPCGNSACVSISGNDPVGFPPASITANGPTSFCWPGSVTLSANTGTGLYYQWKSQGSGEIAGATNSTYTVTSTDVIYCKVSYINGCQSTNSNDITVHRTMSPYGYISCSQPTVCSPSYAWIVATLSSEPNMDNMYQWKKDGVNFGAASTINNLSTNIPGDYTCLIYNQCGSYLTNSITIAVIPSTGTITAAGGTVLCGAGPVTLNANTGAGYTWQWRLNTTAISGATNSSYSPSVAGSYDCIVTNSCGTTTSNAISVTGNLPVASVGPTTPLTICPGGTINLSANTGTGLTYQWRLNFTAISGATNSTYAASSSGLYDCYVSNSCGSRLSNTLTIDDGAAPLASIHINAMSGISYLCTGSTRTLFANQGAGVSYQWRLNGAPVTGATSSTYAASVTGSYDCIETTVCGSATSNIVVLTASTPPPASISAGGPTTFCTGGSVTLTATSSGPFISYAWIKNGNSISGATGSTYFATPSTYVATESGNYSCMVNNYCGDVTYTSVITVNVLSAPAATITAGGPTTFCQGGSVLLSANTGTGLTYQWKKNGTSITGATSSTYSANASGSYTVMTASTCGTATSSAVTVTVSGASPAQPGTITGPSSFCSFQSGVVYSITPVASATSYNWIVPNGATITSGQGTTSITITFGNKNGNIKVAASNSCGTSAYRNKNVNKSCREAEDMKVEEINVVVFPNPGSSHFTLQVSENDNVPFTFKVYDLTGRCMETYESEMGNAMVEFGSSLPSGIYLGEFSTGKERKLLRFVKQE